MKSPLNKTAPRKGSECPRESFLLWRPQLVQLPHPPSPPVPSPSFPGLLPTISTPHPAGILGPAITGIFIYLTRGAKLLKEAQKSDFVVQQLCVSAGSAYKVHVPCSGVPLSAGGGLGAGDILPLFPLHDVHPGPLSAGVSFTLTIKPDVQGHPVNASP